MSGRGSGRSRMWLPMAVIIIVVCAILTGISLLIGFLIPVSGDGDNANVEERYEAINVDEVMIDLDLCDLHIERAAVDQIEFSYAGGDKRDIPQVKLADGILEVSEPRNGGFGVHFHLFGWGRGAYKRSVTIRIPEERCVDLNGENLRFSVDVNAGNVRMNGLYSNSLALDVDAGNVVMNGLYSDSLALDVNAGNVEGDDCRFGAKSEIDVDAGNVEFRKSSFDGLKADVNAGNFSHLQSKIPLDRYDMDLDVDLGEVEVNDKKQGSSYQVQAQPRPLTQEEEETLSVPEKCTMTVEVDLGNIEISDK